MKEQINAFSSALIILLTTVACSSTRVSDASVQKRFSDLRKGPHFVMAIHLTPERLGQTTRFRSVECPDNLSLEEAYQEIICEYKPEGPEINKWARHLGYMRIMETGNMGRYIALKHKKEDDQPESYMIYEPYRKYHITVDAGVGTIFVQKTEAADKNAPDSVVLLNGEMIHGKVQSRVLGEYVIITVNGKSEKISWDRIKEVKVGK